MSEITSTIAVAGTRQIHVRRARLACVEGGNVGSNWQIERDVIRIGSREDNDIRLSDTTVSRLHAEIVRGRDGTILRDLGSTNGTFVGAVRVKEVYLAPDTRFRVGNTHLIFSPADEIIDVVPSQSDRFEGLVGRGLAMREVFGILERVAPTELTVLVTGETGTGKELVSRAIHNRSRRGGRPFVVFDCGAAPETLVESELFGHERGAFTGAIAQREGLFEVADTGTIFIDEIGELPLELQPKLLRVLEQREVRRVGSTKVRHVDVRVVAATNRNLEEAVAAGEFRRDLYFRLKVVEFFVPPLRKRPEDIELLARHFLKRFAAETGRKVRDFTPAAVEAMLSYHWPGNIRELRNCIERAVVLSLDDTVDVHDLALSHLSSAGETGRKSAARPGPFVPETLDELERRHVMATLEAVGGNKTKAATMLGIERSTLDRKLARWAKK